MKNQYALVLTLLLCGCYTTKVYTPAAAHGPELQDRQWFTLGGLVELSDPTGQQCPDGVSKAESKLGGVDILINIGLAVAGGVAGALICNDEADANRNSCTSAGAGLVPFLLGSRTVQYTCTGRGAAAEAPGPSHSAQTALPERRALLGKRENDTSQAGLEDAELSRANSQ